MCARPLVLAVTALLAAPAAAPADDGVVRVRDACDPASFDAAVGPGTCVREGNRGKRVVFDDFLDTLADRGSHPKWSFTPGKMTLGRGDTITARLDKGGEFHTFTEVARFGPGCVQFLNDLIGLPGPPAADCDADTPFVVPGAETTEVAGLSPGVHRFECLIHPWMRTTVTIRR